MRMMRNISNEALVKMAEDPERYEALRKDIDGRIAQLNELEGRYDMRRSAEEALTEAQEKAKETIAKARSEADELLGEAAAKVTEWQARIDTQKEALTERQVAFEERIVSRETAVSQREEWCQQAEHQLQKQKERWAVAESEAREKLQRISKVEESLKAL